MKVKPPNSPREQSQDSTFFLNNIAPQVLLPEEAQFINPYKLPCLFPPQQAFPFLHRKNNHLHTQTYIQTLATTPSNNTYLLSEPHAITNMRGSGSGGCSVMRGSGSGGCAVMKGSGSGGCSVMKGSGSGGCSIMRGSGSGGCAVMKGSGSGGCAVMRGSGSGGCVVQ